MIDKYILAEDGKTPIASTYEEWLRWIAVNEHKRRVARDSVGDAEVSTVFLTLNMAFDDGDPVLWETMIFGGKHDQHQERYTSYDAAVAGHARALAMIKDAA